MKKQFITQSQNGNTITIPAGEVPSVAMDKDFYHYASIIVNLLRSGCPFVQAVNNMRFNSQGGYEISLETLEKHLKDLQLQKEKFTVLVNSGSSVLKIERMIME